LISKAKIHKKDSGLVERSENALEETMELSPKLDNQVEKTHDLTIQSKRKGQKGSVLAEQVLERATSSMKEKPAQSKVPSSVLSPKDQLSQSKK
jgi:hypothetical protein